MTFPASNVTVTPIERLEFGPEVCTNSTGNVVFSNLNGKNIVAKDHLIDMQGASNDIL